jgi:PREDICTED: similar to CG11377-PA
MAEENDDEITNWWLNHRKSNKSLHDHLCVDTLKICCPMNRYGPDCQECPGYPDNVCGKKGICNGMGTKKGTGKCSCNRGYTSKNCDKCSNNHFPSVDKENNLKCNPCDPLCKDGCNGSGPKKCNKCRDDAYLDPKKGCLILNGCIKLNKNPCLSSPFCMNTVRNNSNCFYNLIKMIHLKQLGMENEDQNKWPMYSYDVCCNAHCKR